MRWTVVALVAAVVAVPAWAGSLTVGSGVQWFAASFTDLADYVKDTNRTIDYVNELADVSGRVPSVPLLRGGFGVVIAQAVGRPVGIGGQLLMLKGGVSTEGRWQQAGETFPVALSLDLGMLAGLAQVTLSFANGLLNISLAGGLGMAWLNHSCQFSLPGGWDLPFQPLSETREYRAQGFVGAAGVRALLPLRQGLSLGTEAGLRFAPFGVPKADGDPLDLAQDGIGDRLSFDGLWVGVSVSLTFDL